MRWASAISEEEKLDRAVRACFEEVKASLDGAEPHVAFIFVSDHFFVDYSSLPGILEEVLGSTLLLGCSASGVIGNGHEIERRPSFSLTVAHLPDVTITPFHITDADLPSPDASPEAWEALVGVERASTPCFLILADPYSLNAEDFLAGLDYAFPGSPKLGGLASGAQTPRGNGLYLGNQFHREGAVGVALSGNVVLDTVVAQGCRPVGAPMRITKCDGNLLLEVDSKPPLVALQELYEKAPEQDRYLMQQSLFLGIVMDELKDDYRVGDFLIRNLLRFQRTTGGLWIGAPLREHQTVQFHIRDANTAREDLQAMLGQYVVASELVKPQGALLFSCVGRGAYLFGRPDHDTDLVREYLGTVPLGGFFCNGEIGPVDSMTYLHGYTSSFALFRGRWPE